MSSGSYSELTARFPRDKAAIKRLRALLADARPREYTFAHLYKTVRPSSPEALALVLDELVRRGELRRVYRVESRQTHGGIGDFPSLSDVPDRIWDSRLAEEVEVEPENIRVVFGL